MYDPVGPTDFHDMTSFWHSRKSGLGMVIGSCWSVLMADGRWRQDRTMQQMHLVDSYALNNKMLSYRIETALQGAL